MKQDNDLEQQTDFKGKILMKVVHYRNMLSVAKRNEHGLEKTIWEHINKKDITSKFIKAANEEIALKSILQVVLLNELENHPNYQKVKTWIPKMIWAVMEREGYDAEVMNSNPEPLGIYKKNERFDDAKTLFKDFLEDSK